MATKLKKVYKMTVTANTIDSKTGLSGEVMLDLFVLMMPHIIKKSFESSGIEIKIDKR